MKILIAACFVSFLGACAAAPTIQYPDEPKDCSNYDFDDFVGKDIYFLKNSLKVDPRSLPEVERWADHIRGHTDIISVTLEGNTDDLGSHEGNMKLGLRRAAVVYRMLVEKRVNPELLHVQTYGEELPLKAEFNEMSRAMNRRVHVVTKKRKR